MNLYLHFVFQLCYSGVAFVVGFYLFLLLPALLVTAFENRRIASVLTLASNVIFAYMICLWPAFCVIVMSNYSSNPDVSHTWMYYVTAFVLALLVSIVSIIAVLRIRKNSEASPDEYFVIEDLRAFFLKISVVAIILFMLWPAIARLLYGWFLNRII